MDPHPSQIEQRPCPPGGLISDRLKQFRRGPVTAWARRASARGFWPGQPRSTRKRSVLGLLGGGFRPEDDKLALAEVGCLLGLLQCAMDLFVTVLGGREFLRGDDAQLGGLLDPVAS